METVKVICDLCHAACSTWVDGKTKMGPWGNMRLPCHKRWGVGLGIGKGQQYDNWVQVAGGSQSRARNGGLAYRSTTIIVEMDGEV